MTTAFIVLASAAAMMLMIGASIIGYCAYVCRAIDSTYETAGTRDDIA